MLLEGGVHEQGVCVNRNWFDNLLHFKERKDELLPWTIEEKLEELPLHHHMQYMSVFFWLETPVWDSYFKDSYLFMM